jgi:hypothetical protein
VSAPLTYSGFETVTRPGIGSAIIVKAKVKSEHLQSLLGPGPGYHLLAILDGYDVDIYSLEKIGVYQITADMKIVGMDPILSIKKLKGYGVFFAASKDLELEFEIPVSVELIDKINDIRRNRRYLGLVIKYQISVARDFYNAKFLSGVVERELSGEGRTPVVVFYTDEVDELMKKLRYAEYVRFEVPIPLIPETPIETLAKCARELKGAESAIARGDYPEALRVLRNIIMNNLTQRGEKGRMLKEELKESVLNAVPSEVKEVYEKILDGIEDVLVSNLNHIHKFIKEESGKVIRMPSREEAEYVYLMLVAVLRYISQLVITWSRGG